MNRFLLFIFLFIVLNVQAQWGLTTSYYSAKQKPVFGVLVANAGGTATQKAIIARDSLKSPNFRTRINVMDWDGNSGAYEDTRDLGLSQLVVLSAFAPGSEQPFITSAQRATYKANVVAIFNKYPDIREVVVSNEEQTDVYHRGPLSDYGSNELQAVYEVAHARGIIVSDGGIIDGAGLHIRCYQWLITKYGQSIADDYASDIGMGTNQTRFAKGQTFDANLDFLSKQVDTILSYVSYVDRWNMHHYENAQSESQTATTPNMLRYQTEFLQSTGKPVICNEFGQRNSSQAGLTTNLLNEYYILRYVISEFWSGTSDIGARSLTTDDGTLTLMGKAFRAFVLVH